METVFSVWSAPRLYNENPRPAEEITEESLEPAVSKELAVNVNCLGYEAEFGCLLYTGESLFLDKSGLK
jgi:hypothetical protein